LKKALLSIYLLLTAALVLLPVPGEALSQAGLPASARQDASPASPSSRAAGESESASSSQPEGKTAGKEVYGTLTRLYAPPVPGLSALPEAGGVTANIPPQEASPEGCYLPEEEAWLAEAVNAWRQQSGAAILEMDDALQRSARLRAKEMAQNRCFSHTRPDGRAWITALPASDSFSCPLRGEVFGTALGGTPRQAAERWMEEWEGSPSEKENICLAEFERVGIGIYACEENGKQLSCAVLLFSGSEGSAAE
jgi:uncharacterized protein YkwD